MRRWLSGLALACVLPLTASAQVPPEKALATFTVAEGLELSLFASEPDFVNPTSIDIDHKGRVWVCEAVNYRRKNFGRPILRKEGDRIVILEDTKGVGKADKVHVFYQSPDIIAPLGIAVAPYADGKGQRVYVCQSPDILVFEDKDGDLKADGPPTKLLTGFGGFDHDHGVHGINIGPDGKLYFTVGDTGVKNLQSSDGKGKKWNSNSTDCRAGTVWRCDMDGKNLELIAHNFRNNYECCVDSFGSIFLSDNDDDGNQQTRICYVMPGGNYGYHPRGPGQSHWHEEQPGIVHKIMRTGFGSPCGICVYEGSLLPKKYQGALLHADSGPREIRAFHLKPNGAGYDVEKELLVTSKDNWFRASDVCVAPDGSVFIADWYDPGVGGHGMGDWTRGRIYRLTPKGHKGYKVPEVKLQGNEGMLVGLGSPNFAARYMALAKLARMTNKKQFEFLETALSQDENEWLLARAYWQIGRLFLQGFEGQEATDFYPLYRMLVTPRTEISHILATRVLDSIGYYQNAQEIKEKPQQAAMVFASTRSASARRELLLAMRRLDSKLAAAIILELAKKYDGKDRFYLNAIGIAVGSDPERRKVILADFEKHFPEWNDKVADLVWELRPPSVMPTLGKRLGDPKLSASSRARIIDILATSDDKSAGKAMLDVLQGNVPVEIRDKVLANLKLFLPGKWKDLRGSQELSGAIEGLLAKADTRTAGLDLIAAVEQTSAVLTVAKIALNSQEPLPVRLAAVRTLGALPDRASIKELLSLTNAAPAPLIEAAVQSLGRLAALTAKPHQQTAKDALDVLQGLFRDGKPAARGPAAEALAGTRAGSVWLLDLNEKKQLPDSVKPDVARLLRNSPYQDLRNRAMVAFPPAGKINPKSLPVIAALLNRKGDVNRGKQIFAASMKNDMQCAKCHMVRGQGGQIGPDLSMIGKKASRENLLESVLYPSKAIADQYINWTITNEKGQVLNGLIVEETPQFVLLRDANGKDTKIDKKDIESRAKSPKSLMAEDIVVYLTEDDLIDLTEYMLTLKTAAFTPTAWHIAGPFDNGEGDAGIDKVFAPEKSVDLKDQYDGKSGKVSWRVVRPEGTGYVDLMKFFAADSRGIVSYLYQEIDSPADQDAVILLGHDDACKVWLNGQAVHENRAHVAAAPETHQVKVKLKKGVNKVLLKINNGDGPHGFYFTVVAEQELKGRDGK